MNYTKSELVDYLRKAPCEVRFVKANGEERHMRCTLAESMIPSDKIPKTDGNRKENDNLVIAFDLGINEWRSFNVNRVNSFSFKG